MILARLIADTGVARIGAQLQEEHERRAGKRPVYRSRASHAPVLWTQTIIGASWDEETLRLELAALHEESFDLSLVGFDDEELARLLAAEEATEGLTDEDAVPEVPEAPINVAGDLWRLGPHVLLVGDATNADDVARLMNGAKADLAFTDPPYNVDYEGYTAEQLKIQGDRMSPEQADSGD